MQITPEAIRNSVKRNGIFCVPDRVRIAMEKCLETVDEKAITAEYDRLFTLYKELDEQIDVDYKGAITLDAYVCYYFARNFFIPAIGLSDLAYSTLFQKTPDSINALDIGSGTGAVVFGLLWLFSHPPLAETPIRISALEFFTGALERQKSMIHDAVFDNEKVSLHKGNVCDADSCIKELKGESPFDLIFIANCLTEIPNQNGLDLVERLPEILADKGAIIIAEAQRNYSKKQIKDLITMAPNWGLHVYYPCTRSNHPYTGEYKKYCMAWRDHKYEIPDIKVKGSPLTKVANDELTASWLILTKQDISIYDSCRLERRDLKWGPISYVPETGPNVRYICSDGKRHKLKDDGLFAEYKRGHIIGLSDENEVIIHRKL